MALHMHRTSKSTAKVLDSRNRPVGHIGMSGAGAYVNASTLHPEAAFMAHADTLDSAFSQLTDFLVSKGAKI